LPFFGVELSAKLPTRTIENPQTIGDHIRKRRQQLHLRQSELATLLGVCEDTITGWENGRYPPHVKQYPNLMKFLGYNPFPSDETTLGGRIQKFRLERGISRKQFAVMLNVDEVTLRGWENNLHSPRKRKMGALEHFIKSKEPSS
jgi:DNA-binding transcriptional regulator YiaG